MCYVKTQFKLMARLTLKVSLHFKTGLSLDSAQILPCDQFQAAEIL